MPADEQQAAEATSLRHKGALNFDAAANANTPDGLPEQIPPFTSSLPNGYVE